MIKALAIFGKKDDWSEADFLAHYKERHAPLVAGTAGFTRCCTKYRQNFPVEGEQNIPFQTRPAGRTAVTELWFPSEDDIATAYASEDYMARVRPDEEVFAATDSANVMLCEERPIWSAPIAAGENPDLQWARGSRIRLFVCRVPHARYSAAELQEGWRTAVNGMLDMPFFKVEVRGYLQSLVTPGNVADLAQAPANAIALVEEFTFDTIDAAVRFWTAALDDPELHAIWDHWTDLSDLQLFLARGHLVFE
ncbi:MAG: EthD domain-containing protein [Burkholderiales bacterium]